MFVRHDTLVLHVDRGIDRIFELLRKEVLQKLGMLQLLCRVSLFLKAESNNRRLQLGPTMNQWLEST